MDDSDTEDDTKSNRFTSKSPKDTSKSKKRRVIYSSDEDEPKSSKDANNTTSSKLASKLKAVSVSNAFGNAPIKRFEKEKKSKKTAEDVFDADTDDMELLNVDEKLLSPKSKQNDSDKNGAKVKNEIISPVKSEAILKTKNNKTPEKIKSGKKTPENIKAEKKTPIKKEKHSSDDSKEKSSERKASDDKRSTQRKNRSTTPSSSKKSKKSLDESDLDRSVYDVDQEKHAKRQAAAALYHQFQKRAGPSDPGSKEIPKGKPNCLAGLAFVLTGVYESMERDEAASVIKEFGGRVTGSLSGKTNYIVAGAESGPAKLAKAEEMDVGILSEDDLLDLIREKSGLPTSKPKPKVKEENHTKTPTKREKASPRKTKTERRTDSPAKHESPKKMKLEELNVKSEGNFIAFSILKVSPSKRIAYRCFIKTETADAGQKRCSAAMGGKIQTENN